ncbi:hypothetical protein VOLCADRAFT_95206 [Volvox carteri f. nagariensis]|uniref:Uncharacterized protein n=1 Tax=Volvox carteri f. nagariensis TaxID=3068 RepID=D8U6W5_VOLCA|nr:uncharacterized protein VOLCADRAFT_95206 [Volvox carteri f. nagariensis]EFJ44509.1 hypothetical protein VOLCADRAFT_95206 [Volvox carteri f. nagariensis]|eukprot:XP_002954359.1 hypothetical protein VOLCADRAFT_95206 [Volvox carteri f. nagariensis]
MKTCQPVLSVPPARRNNHQKGVLVVLEPPAIDIVGDGGDGAAAAPPPLAAPYRVTCTPKDSCTSSIASQAREKQLSVVSTHGSWERRQSGDSPPAATVTAAASVAVGLGPLASGGGGLLPDGGSKVNTAACSDLNSGCSDQANKPISALLHVLSRPGSCRAASPDGDSSSAGGGGAAAAAAAALRSDLADASDWSGNEVAVAMGSSRRWVGSSMDWAAGRRMPVPPPDGGGVTETRRNSLDRGTSGCSISSSDAYSDSDGGVWGSAACCSALQSGPLGGGGGGGGDASLWLGAALAEASQRRGGASRTATLGRRFALGQQRQLQYEGPYTQRPPPAPTDTLAASSTSVVRLPEGMALWNDNSYTAEQRVTEIPAEARTTSPAPPSTCLYTSPRQHAFVSLKLRDGPLSGPMRRLSAASLRRNLTGASAPPSPCGRGAVPYDDHAGSFQPGGSESAAAGLALANAAASRRRGGDADGGGGGAAAGQRLSFEQLAAAAVEATQTVLSAQREIVGPSRSPHMATWLALPGCVHLIVYLCGVQETRCSGAAPPLPADDVWRAAPPPPSRQQQVLWRRHTPPPPPPLAGRSEADRGTSSDRQDSSSRVAHSILLGLQVALGDSELVAAARPPLATQQQGVRQAQLERLGDMELRAAEPGHGGGGGGVGGGGGGDGVGGGGGGVGVIEDWPMPGDVLDDDGDDGVLDNGSSGDQLRILGGVARGGRPSHASPDLSTGTSTSTSTNISGSGPPAQRLPSELWPRLHMPVPYASSSTAAAASTPPVTPTSAAHAGEYAMALPPSSGEWGSGTSNSNTVSLTTDSVPASTPLSVPTPPSPPLPPSPPPAPHRAPPAAAPPPLAPLRWWEPRHVASDRSTEAAPGCGHSRAGGTASQLAPGESAASSASLDAFSVIAAARVGSTLVMLDPSGGPNGPPVPVPYTMLLQPPCAVLLPDAATSGDGGGGGDGSGGGGVETGRAVTTVVLLPSAGSGGGSGGGGGSSRRQRPPPPQCRILVTQGDRVLYDAHRLTADGDAGGAGGEPTVAVGSFRYGITLQGARPGLASVHVLGLAPRTVPRPSDPSASQPSTNASTRSGSGFGFESGSGSGVAAAQPPQRGNPRYSHFLTVSAVMIMPQPAAAELMSLYDRMVDEQLGSGRTAAMYGDAAAEAAAAVQAQETRLEAERRVVDDHWIPFVQDLDLCITRRPLPPPPPPSSSSPSPPLELQALPAATSRLLPPRQCSGPTTVGAVAPQAAAAAAAAVPSFGSESSTLYDWHTSTLPLPPPASAAMGPLVLGLNPLVPFAVWDDVLAAATDFLRVHGLAHVLSYVLTAQMVMLGVTDGPAGVLRRRLQSVQRPAASAAEHDGDGSTTVEDDQSPFVVAAAGGGGGVGREQQLMAAKEEEEEEVPPPTSPPRAPASQPPAQQQALPPPPVPSSFRDSAPVRSSAFFSSSLTGRLSRLSEGQSTGSGMSARSIVSGGGGGGGSSSNNPAVPYKSMVGHMPAEAVASGPPGGGGGGALSSACSWPGVVPLPPDSLLEDHFRTSQLKKATSAELDAPCRTSSGNDGAAAGASGPATAAAGSSRCNAGEREATVHMIH